MTTDTDSPKRCSKNLRTLKAAKLYNIGADAYDCALYGRAFGKEHCFIHKAI